MGKVLQSYNPPSDTLKVTSSNIVGKFREAFEVWPNGKWDSSLATGDLVYLDGNSCAASYLVISKSPFNAGTETWIETKDNFKLPIEVSFGAHMSQRTLGQEFAVEVIDPSTPLADVDDIAISSITQAASVLTVDTTAPHGLVVGKSIGIRGCSNQLANYPALVVATVTSPTQFTATAGPGGTIVSQTITNPAGAKGFVYFRERLGRAVNGIAQIFENATATNASFYIRSESGDALPSGTLAGNHSATIGTTASVALVTSPFTYSYSPTTEFRIFAQSDRTQWVDSAVDAVAQTTNRLLRTQVCPDPDANYKFRIRATNNKSVSIVNAEVISVTKSGSTTGTFTTAAAHNLVTGDLIVYYGSSDNVAANFPSLTAATAVTVTGANTFTAVIGTGTTGTAYGGFISKVQAGNLITALGGVTQTVINATLTTLADGVRQLVLTGNGNWAGVAIGDGINIIGVRTSLNGTSLGVDGAWKVANVSTTALTLVPLPGTTPPANFVLTNCGGGVVRRTEFRLSFVRLFDYERERVELLARPAGDIAAAVPVTINNTPAVTVSSGTVTTVTTVTTVGSVTSSNKAIPGIIADVASAALTTTTTTAAVTPTFGCSYQVNIPVTAVSGATPTLDVSIEESDDSGTNWFKVYDFPRITATGMYRSPVIPLTGNRVRYVQTVGGATPSFTRAINRLQSSIPTQPVRQLIDRSVVLTTLGSTTPSLTTSDCGNRVQLVVNVGAITTTAPQLQLEGSDDNGTTWYNIGSPLTAVASSTVQLTVNDIHSQLVRARVSTAGVGVTAGYVLIKGHD